MSESRSHPPSALVGCSPVGALSAVTAIIGAVQHRYALCSIALFALTAGALGVYSIIRKQDTATDRAVLHRLRASPYRRPAQHPAAGQLRPDS